MRMPVPYTDDASRKRLAAVLHSIHDLIPPQRPDTSRVGDWERRNFYLDGRAAERLIIYMRSSGCKWMLDRENHGGCFMCGHLAGTTRGSQLSPSEYISQFDSLLGSVDIREFPVLCIYNAGSFFNDEEVPPAARDHVFQTIASFQHVKHVIFESRPEFVTEEALSSLRQHIPDKVVEVGMGLESSDEEVRQICLNKGFSLSDFTEACELLRSHKVSVLAYVVQKPPFLSEKAAIDDTVQSARWALQNGADVVSIEPVSVQKYTLVHLLHELGMFRPPWVWSVLETIKRTHTAGALRIGGFEFFPPPDICTHNCPACDAGCIEAIDRYNESRDVATITGASEIDCDCKREWERHMHQDGPVEDAIQAFLDRVEEVDVGSCLRRDRRRVAGVPFRLGRCSSVGL
jgi:radical SAM enzyme (TIGR01210 family)